MKELKNLLTYFKVNSFIYDDDITNNLEYEDDVKFILSDEFLEYLLAKIKLNEIRPEIDDQIKQNIYNIVSYIRNHSTSSKNNKIINDIIVSLNNIDTKNNSDFYKKQCLKRSGQLSTINLLKLSKISELKEEMVKSLRESISLDYQVIYYIMNIEDEENKEIFMNMLLLNEEFVICTLNYLSYDFKNIFQMNRFNDKCLYVINEIRKCLNKDNSDDKDVLLISKKLVKKIKS